MMQVWMIFTRGILNEEEAESAHRFFEDKIHEFLDECEERRTGKRSTRETRILTVTKKWRNVNFESPAAIKLVCPDSITDNGNKAFGVAAVELIFKHLGGQYAVVLGGGISNAATKAA